MLSDLSKEQIQLLYHYERQRRQLPPSREESKEYYLLKGRTPREATMYYTSFYGFFIVDPVFSILGWFFPKLQSSFSALFIFFYCYCWSESLSLFVHPLSYLIAIPVTTWIAGIHDIQLCSNNTLNAILSITVIATIVPIISGIPFHFVQLGVLWILKKTFQLPTIYDFHPCSVIGVILFFCLVISLLFDFNAAYEQTTLSLYFTTIFVSGVFHVGGGENTKDNWILQTLRFLGCSISRIITFSVINTFFYFTIGVRVYKIINDSIHKIFIYSTT
jgi:hypothetical protein